MASTFDKPFGDWLRFWSSEDNPAMRVWGPMFDFYRSMAGVGETDIGAQNRGAAPWMGAPLGPGPKSGSARLMTEAYMIFVRSGTRYIAGMWQIGMTVSPLLWELQADKDMAGMGATKAQRVSLDQFRTALRQMAELPAHESRRVQAELESLEGELFSSAHHDTGEYQRRWRYKP